MLLMLNGMEAYREFNAGVNLLRTKNAFPVDDVTDRTSLHHFYTGWTWNRLEFHNPHL